MPEEILEELVQATSQAVQRATSPVAHVVHSLRRPCISMRMAFRPRLSAAERGSRPLARTWYRKPASPSGNEGWGPGPGRGCRLKGRPVTTSPGVNAAPPPASSHSSSCARCVRMWSTRPAGLPATSFPGIPKRRSAVWLGQLSHPQTCPRKPLAPMWTRCRHGSGQ